MSTIDKDFRTDIPIKVFHADHGIASTHLLTWALAEIDPKGFFLRTLEIPADAADLLNALYGPASGDASVPESEVFYAHRGGEGRGLSRMIERPKRPTRLLTIIGMATPEGINIFTAYGGPAAEREPTDPSIANDEEAKRVATEFWSKHALASQ